VLTAHPAPAYREIARARGWMLLQRAP